MIEIKAPKVYNIETSDIKVFLGGSIDMGAAEEWQFEVMTSLSHIPNLILFNPRRDNWDPSLPQDKNNAQFREQVEWELDYQDQAHVIIYYFARDSKAPVTLMELGLFGPSSAFVHVYCPEGFYRKGNVDIVCERMGIPVHETYNDLITNVKQTLTEVYGLQENN